MTRPIALLLTGLSAGFLAAGGLLVWGAGRVRRVLP